MRKLKPQQIVYSLKGSCIYAALSYPSPFSIFLQAQVKCTEILRYQDRISKPTVAAWVIFRAHICPYDRTLFTVICLNSNIHPFSAYTLF